MDALNEMQVACTVLAAAMRQYGSAMPASLPC